MTTTCETRVAGLLERTRQLVAAGRPAEAYPVAAAACNAAGDLPLPVRVAVLDVALAARSATGTAGLAWFEAAAARADRVLS